MRYRSLLNGEIFYRGEEGQIEQLRKYYNTIGAHSALGYQPPESQAMNLFLTTRDWPTNAICPAGPGLRQQLPAGRLGTRGRLAAL
jgi:hypothetical protein